VTSADWGGQAADADYTRIAEVQWRLGVLRTCDADAWPFRGEGVRFASKNSDLGQPGTR